MMKVSTTLFVAALMAGTSVAITEEEIVCQGVRDAIYSTDFEALNDPCSDCQYNVFTRELSVECRYDYCAECDNNGNCAQRVIEIDTIVTEEALNGVLGGGSLDLGETTKFCVDYTEGNYDDKMICVLVENSFEGCQGQNLMGLPFLTCSGSTGCECASGSAATDSSFVGFETIGFQTCYDESALAKSTNISGGRAALGIAALAVPVVALFL